MKLVVIVLAFCFTLCYNRVRNLCKDICTSCADMGGGSTHDPRVMEEMKP